MYPGAISIVGRRAAAATTAASSSSTLMLRRRPPSLLSLLRAPPRVPLPSSSSSSPSPPLLLLRRVQQPAARPLLPHPKTAPTTTTTTTTRSLCVSRHGPNLPSSSRGGGGYGVRYQRQPPPPRGKRPMPLYIKVTGVFFAAGGVLYLSTYEQAPHTGRWRPMPVSKAMERQLGEQAIRAMVAKFQGRILPPDHKTSRLLRKVGRKLAIAAGCEDLPWEFYVVDADEIMNAAAMPGGKVVLFTGLKKCVTTEEDLAAVLGHEISHVVLRHSAEQMGRAAALQYLFLFLAILGLPINELTLLLGDLTFSKPNSRTHELEADEMGVYLCAKAGYDPAAAIRVFKRMEQLELRQNALRVPGFLSTHPVFSDRIAKLQRKAEEVRPLYEDTRAGMFGYGNGGAGAAY